jgi:hypothetical protein
MVIPEKTGVLLGGMLNDGLLNKNRKNILQYSQNNSVNVDITPGK